jgi:hypothetical protein
MPLVKPEDVVSFVIADDKIRDHLRRAEMARSRTPFRDYIAQFGVYDLGEVSEEQMFALVAARNTAPIIDLLQIPRGRDLVSGPAAASYDIHRQKTSLGPAVFDFMSPVPSAERDLEVLRDAEDIPDAVPEDLLLRRLAPDEFLRRLTEGELLRSAWIQDELDDLKLAEIQELDATTRPESSVGREDARPRGFLLLDTSESMGSGRDRRGEVARGLALAYLHSQYEAGNPTVLYLFRHELSSPIGGEGRMAFESAVSAVLAHSYQGMTHLQEALRLLADTMKAQFSRVDIALITDGVTRLTENPVPDSHLHTFLVGVRPEELDSFGAKQYQESLLKLREWSDFHFAMDPEILKRAAIPRKEDVLDATRMLYGLEQEWSGTATSDKVRRIKGRIHNLVRLCERFRDNERRDEDVEAAYREAVEAQTHYGSAIPEDVAIHNSPQWNPVDRDLAIALEARECSSALRGPALGPKWTVQPQGATELANPIEILMEIIRIVKEWFRRHRPRLHRRRSRAA